MDNINKVYNFEVGDEVRLKTSKGNELVGEIVDKTSKNDFKDPEITANVKYWYFEAEDGTVYTYGKQEDYSGRSEMPLVEDVDKTLEEDNFDKYSLGYVKQAEKL